MARWILLAALLASPSAQAGVPQLPSLGEPVRLGKTNANDAALVMGNESYTSAAKVPYAAKDATVMAEWLEYSLGLGDNVRKLTDASLEDMSEGLNRQLSLVKPGGTLWVYFAGHGIADPATKGRVLLGNDANPANPSAISKRGLAVDEIKRRAAARGVDLVLVLDACYTGSGRGSERLIPEGTRALFPVGQLDAAPSVVEWVATDSGEVAAPFDAARHGAFTYFVVGALRGWADGELGGGRDGNVTVEEARSYVKRMVGRTDARQQPKMIVGGKMQQRLSSLLQISGVTETGPAADVVEQLARGRVASDGSIVVVQQNVGDGVSKADADALARSTAEAAARQRSVEEQRRQEAVRLQQKAEEARQAQVESERRLRELEEEAARARAEASGRQKDLAAKQAQELRALADREYEALAPLLASDSPPLALLEQYVQKWTNKDARVGDTRVVVDVPHIARINAILKKTPTAKLSRPSALDAKIALFVVEGAVRRELKGTVPLDVLPGRVSIEGQFTPSGGNPVTLQWTEEHAVGTRTVGTPWAYVVTDRKGTVLDAGLRSPTEEAATVRVERVPLLSGDSRATAPLEDVIKGTPGKVTERLPAYDDHPAVVGPMRARNRARLAWISGAVGAVPFLGWSVTRFATADSGETSGGECVDVLLCEAQARAQESAVAERRGIASNALWAGLASAGLGGVVAFSLRWSADGPPEGQHPVALKLEKAE